MAVIQYDQAEYFALMDKFRDHGIPLAVSVIDMDWHLVDGVDPKFGNGWTGELPGHSTPLGKGLEKLTDCDADPTAGYTWNEDLFPDPAAFLTELKRRNLRSTLNLHPAHGVRAFEEQYGEMCRVLGRSPEQEDPIVFDVSDKAFMDAYFDVLHRKLERQGVDFWASPGSGLDRG